MYGSSRPAHPPASGLRRAGDGRQPPLRLPAAPTRTV